MADKMFDIVIIGGGPAGLTAAIYAARFKMSAVVLAKMPGGLLTSAHLIENWPGFESITGIELMKRIQDHVEKLGVKVLIEDVIDINKSKEGFKVRTEGKTYDARTILFATGTERRRLGVRGESDFLGKGVSYCAVCDGPFFKEKTVAVVGGSDAAAKEALLLTRWAKKVYIIYRKQEIRPEPATADAVKANKKIEIVANANVTEIMGKRFVEAVQLDNGKKLSVDGVFIEIGGNPISAMAKKLGVSLNDRGEIVTDKDGRTNVPGIYAAGDVTNRTYKQALMAAAEGASAIFSAYRFMKEGKE
ncbi:MAG: FAD-dependent oxidoreductase [Candidatus Aenigmatarchaeota archaeon]